MFLAVLIVAGLLTPLPATAVQAQAPWLGTWRLNPAKSTENTDTSPYKRVTLRIESWGDGLRAVYDMVGIRGGTIHMEWTGRFDGRDYPVQGLDYVLTNAYTQVDEHTYTIAVKADGSPVASVRVTISPDRQTMTATTTERNPQGQQVTRTAVYDRLR